jgi:hypothetical protein
MQPCARNRSLSMRPVAVMGLVVLVAAGVAACGSRRAPVPQAPAPVPVQEPTEPPVTAVPTTRAPAPAPVPVANWEAMLYTSRSLDRHIARGSQRLAAGSLDDPKRLASLRVTAEGRDLLARGAVDRAMDRLERAVAMDGRNGFAWMYLAFANHRRASFDQGLEQAAAARRYLPADAHVLGELAGLEASLRLNAR